MAPVSKEPVVISGFTLISTKFKDTSKAGHYLYVKEHSVRESHFCKPRDRTLFVLNVPPYVDQACLKHLFSCCGEVQDVMIHQKPTSAAPVIEESKYFKTHLPVVGFKVAYVVFDSAKAVSKAKKIPIDDVKILSTTRHPLKVGMKKWCSNYKQNVPGDPREMQKEINKFMEEYDEKKEEFPKIMKNLQYVKDFQKDLIYSRTVLAGTRISGTHGYLELLSSNVKNLWLGVSTIIRDNLGLEEYKIDEKIAICGDVIIINPMEIQKAKEQEGKPDEDGWITVTKYGKNKGAPRTEANERKIIQKDKKKKKEKELLNFYSHQMRESKREHIANLREQFEKDKNKIALMREQRKFKPY